MANIFNIQQDLLNIFDELEENGGELTPELEEQLNITQEEFKSKIKSYANVVKMLENDIIDIKAEKARLSSLQESKEKTIERIKKIMAEAIELFGDSTKSGGKYIDYGTGKVSMRITQAVEIDEDATNRFVNRYIIALNRYNMMNQLDSSIIGPDELIDYVNSQSPDEEQDNVEVIKFNSRDLETLNAVINLDVPINELLNSIKGFNLIKAIINYGLFNIKGKVNKTEIKKQAKDTQFVPIYSTIVNNKSITIK